MEEQFRVLVPAGQTVHLTWPTPWVFSRAATSGRKFCVQVEGFNGPGGYLLPISANGYVY